MSPNKNHVHKLRKHVYKRSQHAVYFCMLEDCSFKIDCALALGKRSICNLCNKEFILTEYTVKLARPHCDACSKVKITGADGKGHFVRKNTIGILSDVADNEVSDLRSRMEQLTTAVVDSDI